MFSFRKYNTHELRLKDIRWPGTKSRQNGCLVARLHAVFFLFPFQAAAILSFWETWAKKRHLEDLAWRISPVVHFAAPLNFVKCIHHDGLMPVLLVGAMTIFQRINPCTPTGDFPPWHIDKARNTPD